MGTLINTSSLIWAPAESDSVRLMFGAEVDMGKEKEGSDAFRWVDEHVLRVSALD